MWMYMCVCLLLFTYGPSKYCGINLLLNKMWGKIVKCAIIFCQWEKWSTSIVYKSKFMKRYNIIKCCCDVKLTVNVSIVFIFIARFPRDSKQTKNLFRKRAARIDFWVNIRLYMNKTFTLQKFSGEKKFWTTIALSSIQWHHNRYTEQRYLALPQEQHYNIG